MRQQVHPVRAAAALIVAMLVSAAPTAHADAPASPLTMSGHFDIDAMAASSGTQGDRSETSAQFQWGGSWDTAAAGWWTGGLFEFSVEGVRAGGSGGAGTGAVQIPSNEWAPDFLRVYQATYRHDFGEADVRAGIMDVNQYFESSDQAALLHNSSFGMTPTVMADFDGPSYPNPGLGAMGELRLGDAWRARAGVWQGEPPGLSGVFDHGAMSIAEVERDWAGADAGTPGSDLKLGAWHDQQRDPTDGLTGSGAYLVGETRWKAADRQWGAFVLGGTAPAQGELVRDFLACGLLVAAPLASRPNDQASVGLTRVRFAAGAPETVAEAVYSWQVDDALAVQPDLQRFWNPGGNGPAAWVGGVRLHLGF